MLCDTSKQTFSLRIYKGINSMNKTTAVVLHLVGICWTCNLICRPAIWHVNISMRTPSLGGHLESPLLWLKKKPFAFSFFNDLCTLWMWDCYAGAVQRHLCLSRDRERFTLSFLMTWQQRKGQGRLVQNHQMCWISSSQSWCSQGAIFMWVFYMFPENMYNVLILGKILHII